MNHTPASTDPFATTTADFAASIAGHELSRRGLFRVGGMTIALAALVAACAEEASDANPARVGSAPTIPPLPDGVVTDGVLFRTTVSIHYTIIAGHEIAKKLGGLTAEQTALVDSYIAANTAAIADLDDWTIKAGSKPWTCSNPRFDRVILGPIEDRITGRPKQGSEETDVAPSDDPQRDCMALAHELETLGAATHQSFVPQFSQPVYRAATISHGVESARRAAALARVINPDNVVNPTALLNANLDVTVTTEAGATTTTQNIAANDDDSAVTTTSVAAASTIQQYYAIPSQFGTLSAIQFSLGAFTSGTQFTINIDTPSLNSFVYDYMTDC